MNFLQWTKGVFCFRVKKVDTPVWAARDPATQAQVLEERYGEDFTAFLYRRDLYEVLSLEALPVLQPNGNNDFLDHSYWKDKHPFNFPGPFYTGQTDTCGTGAPEN